jgi:hypothetical protein
MFVLFLLLRFSLSPIVMPWLKMSMTIVSVTIIANGVVPPVSMVSFPSMETLQPEWFTEQPDIARPQIEILVTNETDVFIAIPGVTVRNHHRLLHHRLRSHNYEWLERHPPIWLNHTA